MKQYYLKKDDIYLFFNVFKRNPNFKNLNQLLRFYKCFKIDINKIILNNLSIIHIKQKKETMKLIIDYGGDTNNITFFGNSNGSGMIQRYLMEGNYSLIATNVFPFGYKTVDGFHSELLLFRRIDG